MEFSDKIYNWNNHINDYRNMLYRCISINEFDECIHEDTDWGLNSEIDNLNLDLTRWNISATIRYDHLLMEDFYE